jgi:hypothetical protein
MLCRSIIEHSMTLCVSTRLKVTIINMMEFLGLSGCFIKTS